MSVPCRCSRCRTRRSLRHSPGWYIRQPRCKVCGGKLSIDTYRAKGKEKRPACNCGGLPFPHRHSSFGCLDQSPAAHFHSRWRQEEGLEITTSPPSSSIPF
jgi:hypothetical protein